MTQGQLKLTSLQAAYYLKLIKHRGQVRRVFVELTGEVLASPVLVVIAALPKARARHIVNIALVSHPNFVTVLAIAQGQLAPGIYF